MENKKFDEANLAEKLFDDSEFKLGGVKDGERQQMEPFIGICEDNVDLKKNDGQSVKSNPIVLLLRGA